MSQLKIFFVYVGILFLGGVLVQAAPPTQEELYEFGVRVRAMVSAYQAEGENANIFIPTVRTAPHLDGEYLKRKGKICIFASGGLQNSWEKTVSQAYFALYGEAIKIIRAAWVQKHLVPDLEEKYRAHPQDLHAELFFTLYVRKFKANVENVRAFSWWRPCDDCHREMLGFQRRPEGSVSYTISYAHFYPCTYLQSERFRFQEIPDYKRRSEEIWADIWRRVVQFADRPFSNAAEKEKFWAHHYQGICLSKWLAQVFVEDMSQEEISNAEEGISLSLEQISPFLARVDKQEVRRVKDLVEYLRRVNWEFSCWFSNPLPHRIQKNWNKYWKGAVVPHFGWKSIGTEEQDERGMQHCEMCGYSKGLKDLYYVYHPKHTPAKEEKITQGYQRKKSLTVGSECVRFLGLTREDVEKLQAKALREEQEKIALEQREKQEKEKRRREAQKRKEEDSKLEALEKKIKEQKREERDQIKRKKGAARERRKK